MDKRTGYAKSVAYFPEGLYLGTESLQLLAAFVAFALIIAVKRFQLRGKVRSYSSRRDSNHEGRHHRRARGLRCWRNNCRRLHVVSDSLSRRLRRRYLISG
jgi:hypothetical protein